MERTTQFGLRLITIDTFKEYQFGFANFVDYIFMVISEKTGTCAAVDRHESRTIRAKQCFKTGVVLKNEKHCFEITSGCKKTTLNYELTIW